MSTMWPPLRLSLLSLTLTLQLLLPTAYHGVHSAPDITMSIHGAGWPSAPIIGGGGVGSGVGTADDHGQSSFTVNQVHTLLYNIEFRLRDLSNTFKRDQQTERVNSRIDMLFNKLNHLEVSNGMWFEKFQQSVMEECGPNHMTRRLDKAQQQLELTLEHMETTLQTVQNHQKELEKDIRKMADKQTELSADIQSMRKDMSSEFDKHNSSQNVFQKQLQETVTNLSQQSKITDKSLTTCSCNQNDDPSQISDTVTTNKLTTTVNNMYNGINEHLDNTDLILKELFEITEKYRRKLDTDRHDVINEVLESFWEAAIGEIATIHKKSENDLETKFKEEFQLLMDKQNIFMNNCHRLQSNERQIENDMVLILERILDHVNNKTLSESTMLEQISKMLKTQSSMEEKMFTEFSELNKYQSNQVARTVAYSTNQVMMLHQDVLNISNKLMAVNFGIDKISNASATTTDVNNGVVTQFHNTSNNSSNPLMSKNQTIVTVTTIEKPTTTPQGKSNVREK